jgi:hypothetical protein
MDRYVFPEGEEPEVLISVSVECQGEDHAACHGIFTTEETGNESVFCVCRCHLAPGRPS